MKSYAMIFIVLLGTLSSNQAFAIFAPDAKITLKVIDENGVLVSDTNVSTTFSVPNVKRGGIKYNSVKGLSGNEGTFTASNRTMEHVSYSATKDGYYVSRGIYKFKDSKNDRWLPWNPTLEIVLRKIENPVPMYKRDMERFLVELPVAGKEIGFDLIAYDWVSPYGKGNHPDFIVKLERQVESNDKFESILTITFPNKFDGLLLIKDDRKGGSSFKLPRYAPETGYQNKLKRELKSIPGKPLVMDSRDDNNFIFRVRSEEKDGKLVKAMYGKIYGDILFEPRFSKTAVFGFKYFLNPDYTRNLENGKNLFSK